MTALLYHGGGRRFFINSFGYLELEFGAYLACLREAALACQRICSASRSAKAGI